jgi:acyl-CoA thioesterase I
MMIEVKIRALPLLAALMMIGCEAPERNGTPGRSATPDAPAPTAGAANEADSAPATVEDRPIVLFVGTSLTAGLGLSPEQSFPAVVQEKIDSAGLPFQAVNAGVSGETSAGALRRVDWLLRQPFEVLVLETGANDMLRGFNVDSTRANIQSIIDRVRAERPEARIVLVGMLASPNLGRQYGERFQDMYPDLARRNELPLVPFLLEDVAAVPNMNLQDGIHPNAAGQRRVAQNVWPVLEPVLRERAAAE